MNVITELASCPLCDQSFLSTHASGKDFEYETTGDHQWYFERCQSCGLLVLNPRPAPQEMQRIYPVRYYAYDFAGKNNIGYRIKTFLDRLSTKNYLAPIKGLSGDILDVGCGDGRLLEIFRRTGYSTEQLYGAELDLKAVEAAKKKGFQIFHGKIEDADFRPSSFKLIILQQVIEHVTNPVEVLNGLKRLLIPGGVIILETPNTDSWDHHLFQKRYWGGYHFPRHFYLFSPNSIRRLCQKTHLEFVAIKSLPSPSFWIQSIHHYAKEKQWSLIQRVFHPHRPSVVLLAIFTMIDSLAMVIAATSNMRVIFRKSNEIYE